MAPRWLEDPRVVGLTYPSNLLAQHQVLMFQHPLVLRREAGASEASKQKRCWALCRAE